MSHNTRVLLYALGVLLAFSLISYVSTSNLGVENFALATLAFALLEFVILLITGAVLWLGKFPGPAVPAPDQPLDGDLRRTVRMSPRANAGAYFLAALFVLVVGTSICFGAAAV